MECKIKCCTCPINYAQNAHICKFKEQKCNVTYDNLPSNIIASNQSTIQSIIYLSNQSMSQNDFTQYVSHRTTGCFDDRLLTMMTDTGFYVSWRVGYNFRLAKLLEKSSGTLWSMSTLVSVARSYRSKLMLYLSQIKPHLIIISEVSWEKSQNTVIGSSCASLRQSLLSALIFNKTIIIQLHFCQIWSRSLIL